MSKNETAMEKPKILTSRELRTIMPRLAGWSLKNNKLSRTFEFQDFVQSLSFVNSLVAYFETVDHHPDVHIAYGEVTFELTRMVGPAGHAVGVDMDEVKLDLARKDAAARGMSNVEFRTANVNEWDDPAAYDLVYCRFLLEHLGQPDELLQRMWAAVRPGGTIAVEATDFDGEFGEPPNEAFATAQRLYRALVDHRGGDPVAGRRMFRRFLDAGIP